MGIIILVNIFLKVYFFIIFVFPPKAGPPLADIFIFIFFCFNFPHPNYPHPHPSTTHYIRVLGKPLPHPPNPPHLPHPPNPPHLPHPHLPPRGIEPRFQAPQAYVLSVERRGRNLTNTKIDILIIILQNVYLIFKSLPNASPPLSSSFSRFSSR